MTVFIETAAPAALTALHLTIAVLRRHAVAADPARPITPLYSARGEHDVAFHSELRVLAERHPQIRVAVTLTQPTQPTRLRAGRVDEAMVRQFVPAPADTIFCLCGPGRIEDLRSALAGLGVPAGQVRYEQFEMAIAASQVNAPAAIPLATTTPPAADEGVRLVQVVVVLLTLLAFAGVFALQHRRLR